MGVRRDPGPNYPWGNDPWPGTADDVSKDPDTYVFNKADFDAVIDRLTNTGKTNTGVEAANVQVVDMVTVDTIQPGQPALPVTPGGQ